MFRAVSERGGLAARALWFFAPSGNLLPGIPPPSPVEHGLEQPPQMRSQPRREVLAERVRMLLVHVPRFGQLELDRMHVLAGFSVPPRYTPPLKRPFSATL